MEEHRLTLKHLDTQLITLRDAGADLMPNQGWVRTIRKAIGMTIKQLAARLQVTQSRVVKIETAEPNGAITLKTLESVAEKLNCRLVYALVPNTTFEEMLEKQAKKVALEQIKQTAHTMSLENQSVKSEWQEEQLNDLSQALLRKSWKHLWED